MVDKIDIGADTRHTKRWAERNSEPLPCSGDLACFCTCPVTLECLRLWAQRAGVDCDLQGRKINFANTKTLVGRCRDPP